jgi:hypothetical protein
LNENFCSLWTSLVEIEQVFFELVENVQAYEIFF